MRVIRCKACETENPAPNEDPVTCCQRCGAMVYSPSLDFAIKEGQAAMIEKRKVAWAKRDWERFLCLHPRPERWRALFAISSYCQANELPGLFRGVWTDSEQIWSERQIIDLLIRQVGGHNRKFMDPLELERFDSLPERFTIYRGAKAWNLRGMSWTLNRETAVYFATHHHERERTLSLASDQMGVVMKKRSERIASCFTRTKGKSRRLYLLVSKKDRILLKAQQIKN